MKKRSIVISLFVTLLFSWCASLAAQTLPDAPGPYSKCTYKPPVQSGYSSAKVYYPCNAKGLLAATTLTGGFANTYNDVEWLAQHLVTHGYIVFALTPPNIYGFNDTWTVAHKAGIQQLRKESTRAGSPVAPNPIQGRVDTKKLQVMGFSKGGGGALLAAADLKSNIQAAQALAPYMDFAYDLRNIKAKTACYTGKADSIAPAQDVIRIYNRLPRSIDRTLGYFWGFTHTDWMSGASYNPYNNRAKKYITAFMKYQLDGDVAYRTHLYGAEHNKDVSAGWFAGYAHNTDY